MFIEKIKFIQGYVKVKLVGYAPERFLNLCSNYNILIWNLQFKEEHYEFYISLKGFRRLKPILRKTKTRMFILERHGIPFFFHKYRKRKLFFSGILLCMAALYTMSLFIWNIEVNGNSHRTDSTIIQFLSKQQVYHGIWKNKINCPELEELIRSEFDDVIWASAKIQGTRLIIDIQENLITNQAEALPKDDTPTDLVADKEAVVYSIITRAGTPAVQSGMEVKPGDMLVEGKIPILSDFGELIRYQYAPADADVLGETLYPYKDSFSLSYQDKVFTGEEKNFYRLQLFSQLINLKFSKKEYSRSDIVTEEFPLRLSENFYLPLKLYRETAKEYNIQKKQYKAEEAIKIAQRKLDNFCEKLKEKGVQIVENNVMIVIKGKICQAEGSLKLIEPIGKRQTTEIVEIPQEGQITDESDGDSN